MKRNKKDFTDPILYEIIVTKYVYISLCRYEYDNGGRVIKTTNAAGDSATVTYDETDNVLTSTDFAGLYFNKI